MALKRKFGNSEHLRTELLHLLEKFESLLQNEDLRPKVLHLVKAFQTLRQLGVSVVPMSDESGDAARDRILSYLRRYVGQVINGEELMVVSGILDYARRVRELRVELGWRIVSGVSLKEMIADGNQIQDLNYAQAKADDYVLLLDQQDKLGAYRWNRANSIRKGGDNVKAKILKFLRENVGEQVSSEEIRYVANGATEWARRVRELRTEEGWPIATKQTGRPDLSIGIYVLERDSQGEQHDRKIPDALRVRVLERDRHSCQRCGWKYDQHYPGDPRHLLELHHVHHHSQKGENVLDNLVTLCNVCHDLVHRLDRGHLWNADQFHRWCIEK